jgi:predicted TIM-barrel fold metal-dependent hydrolase
MIIDCHVHVLDDTSKTPEEIVSVFDSAGIDRAVVLSDDPGEHTDVRANAQYVLDLGRASDGRIIPFVWLNPLADDCLDVLAWAADEGIAGVKLIPDHWYPYDPPALRLYERVQDLDLPILFHSGILWLWGDTSRHCRPVNYEALMEFPNIRFALGHVGWPWVHECYCVINKNRNLRRKRGLSPHQAYGDLTPGMPESQRLEHVRFALEFIGDEHLIFGSDDRVGGGYCREVVASYRRVFEELDVPLDSQEKIWSGNALRWLGQEG